MIEPRYNLTDLRQIHRVRSVTTEKVLLRQPGMKFRNAHRHRIFFVPCKDTSYLFLRTRIVNIVRIRYDNFVIFQQINTSWSSNGAGFSSSGLPSLNRLLYLSVSLLISIFELM